MKKNLRNRLSLSYIFITMICVALISILSKFFLENQFKNYVIQERQRENKIIVSAISQQYKDSENFNIDAIQSIGASAIESGLFITVKNESNKVIWDAETYNNIKCEEVKNRLITTMETLFPKWKGEYAKDEYPILNNSNKIGTIYIGHYGPFYYDENDIMYSKTLNKILIGVGIVSLCCALLLGLIMAEGLSRPILKVINIAEMISKGDYTQKIDKKSNIEEIDKLTTTINSLGYSLNEQEKLRQRLTRDVSHELRTPLSTLQSHMEALIDGIWEPTPERLISCHEEIIRLKRLVGDLEKLAQYESENLILNKTKFNIGEVVKNIVFNFEKEFLNKEVTLNFHDKDIVTLLDKDKITQVIVNLISNALKYTPKGGKVDINIYEDNNYIVLSVKDTGVGISSDDLPYVFERFYRADESRNKLTGGAGIGLTISKSIIEAHSGNITVDSIIGKGTNFVVKVPKIV
ncbi:sensor histidine kinase [Clostridium saccharobutylicum]|uniref:histidine kinase n=1 Tax=Clostridium saccharobutylicum TaxID=169679 RepID=A0A1S8N1N8_CLOSA|nr:ATP-binding protein [Clostridium saccharobutylicum]OOM10385.1 sensor histidine kinase YycG [Clostridium saccharobutylicum]